MSAVRVRDERGCAVREWVQVLRGGRGCRYCKVGASGAVGAGAMSVRDERACAR